MTRFGPRLPRDYRLVFFDSIDSTNDEAKRLARNGAPEGTLFWSLEQTAGRGRRGRVWASPRGNFYASLIRRPDCKVNRAVQLGFVAALAAGAALRAILPRVEALAYKWPNDVLINGRKIGGVLLESEMTAAGELSFVIIGAGINLSRSPQDTEFPATSVIEEGLGSVPPEVMLEQFAHQFHSWEARWRSDGFAPVRAAWLAAVATSRGEPIRVRLESTTLHGRFLDLDENGALLLDCAGGHRRISAGEVFPASH
jgi:BirA family biotin operon repressor/biotin-[acetyl-CoA-carboxylase] ligase